MSLLTGCSASAPDMPDEASIPDISDIPGETVVPEPETGISISSPPSGSSEVYELSGVIFQFYPDGQDEVERIYYIYSSLDIKIHSYLTDNQEVETQGSITEEQWQELAGLEDIHQAAFTNPPETPDLQPEYEPYGRLTVMVVGGCKEDLL